MGYSVDWMNEEKFRAFFYQYYKDLYYFAYGYVNDMFIAEDIVSESFVKLWTHMTNIQELAMKKYLFQIVKNACIDHLRSHRDFYPVEEYHTLADLDEGPLDYLITLEDELRIQTAMQELPQLYQELLMLRNLEKLKYSKIAKQMDLSVNTVKSNLRAATIILEKHINRTGKENA